MSNLRLPSDPAFAAAALKAWPAIDAKLAERDDGAIKMTEPARDHLRREGIRIARWGGSHFTPWHYRRGE